MDYQVTCGCGRSVPVNAGAAGSQVTCGCGRVTDIPSLRELRRLNGEDYNVNPVIEIRRLLATGELPPGRACLCCGRDDAATYYVAAECERRWVRRRGRWAWLVLLPLGFIHVWFHAMADIDVEPARTEVLNEGLTLNLPLPVCASCRADLHGQSSLRELLRQVPPYARLLDRYPKAKLKASVGA